MKVLTQKFVPKKYKIEFFAEHKLRISFGKKDGGRNPISIILPKYIQFDENFIAGCAMYLGDGKKKDKMHLDFVSKDKNMVKFMLEFFMKYFNWSKERIRYTLTYKNYRRNMIEDWAKYLRVSQNDINIKQSNRHKEECLGMQISSVIFKGILINIFDYLLKNFILNQKNVTAFLQGIFAAEGCVAVMYSENYLGNVGMYFSTEEDHLVNFVGKLLDYFSINYSFRIMEKMNCKGIVITEWNNYWQLFKIRIFDLNERKRDTFLMRVEKTNFWLQITDNLKLALLDGTNKRQLAMNCNINYLTLYYRFKAKSFSLNQLRTINSEVKLDLNFIKNNILSVRVGPVTEIRDDSILDFLFTYLW